MRGQRDRRRRVRTKPRYNPLTVNFEVARELAEEPAGERSTGVMRAVEPPEHATRGAVPEGYGTDPDRPQQPPLR